MEIILIEPLSICETIVDGDCKPKDRANQIRISYKYEQEPT